MFVKNKSNLCETKAVLVSLSLFLQVAASFCIYQTYTENNVDTVKKAPCENEYKKFCLNGGDCFCQVDEVIEGCICTWLFGGKRCERFIWRTS